MEATVSDYSRVLELVPEDAEAFNNRGLAFDDLGEYELALEDYGCAISLRPGFSESFNNRGLLSSPWGQGAGSGRVQGRPGRGS